MGILETTKAEIERLLIFRGRSKWEKGKLIKEVWKAEIRRQLQDVQGLYQWYKCSWGEIAWKWVDYGKQQGRGRFCGGKVRQVFWFSIMDLSMF